MRTLFWKELRENAKWALLAMLALGAAEIHTLYQAKGASDLSLCGKSFLTVTAFGCPAIGLFLGFIQIIPELGRDSWAFLVHRPASRTVIFLGKVAAGLLLYAVAAVAPFLFCVWLAATPGHLTVPFVPGLALAGTADACGGMAFYFGALLLALNRTGWKGTWWLPLGAAIHLSVTTQMSVLFRDAITATVVTTLVLGLAAWSAMSQRESASARSWISKAALLAVGYFGACWLPVLSDAMQPVRYARYSYELTEKGIPIKIVTREDGIVASVQDLEGREIQDRDLKPDSVRNHAKNLNVFAVNVGETHGWRSKFRGSPYRDSYKYLWTSFSSSNRESAKWFYLNEQRFFVRVPPGLRRVTERFDRQGFSSILRTPTPFASGMEVRELDQDHWLIWNPDSVLLVDFFKHQETILSLPESGPVYGAATPWARNDCGSVQVIVAALKSKVAVWDSESMNLIATLPYQQDPDRWGGVSIGINGTRDRFYLEQSPSAWIAGKEKGTMPSYLEEMDAKGNILKSYTLPALPEDPQGRTWVKALSEWTQSPVSYFGEELRPKLNSQPWKGSPMDAVGVLLSSALCAGFAVVWARSVQIAWPHVWRWAALVFVFNVTGLFMFRFVARWPRLAPCRQCGGKRRIDEEQCSACHSNWPELDQTGTEIFETSVVASQR